MVAAGAARPPDPRRLRVGAARPDRHPAPAACGNRASGRVSSVMTPRAAGWLLALGFTEDLLMRCEREGAIHHCQLDRPEGGRIMPSSTGERATPCRPGTRSLHVVCDLRGLGRPARPLTAESGTLGEKRWIPSGGLNGEEIRSARARSQARPPVDTARRSPTRASRNDPGRRCRGTRRRARCSPRSGCR